MKGSDLVELLERHGPPPKIIWLTCGHTSGAALRKILTAHFQEGLCRWDAGDEPMEIGVPQEPTHLATNSQLNLYPKEMIL